jgi:2-polyprenyl-3-methyl-5-hydroxy-6-metoxy-1,4-benzoquinol methylase
MVSMQFTDSERRERGRYEFSFAWESAYGHAVRLIERLEVKPGMILDLGCGFGTVAESLKERGYEYVGADLDRDALEKLSLRGFETHELDLGATDELADRMSELAGERDVTAVLMLDVIEHLPQTRRFLQALRDGLGRLGGAVLVVSVPNVSHVDLGAKLVFGKWDYTATGLLDGTHLQLFTDERLKTETRACGLLEVGAHDFRAELSDQHFPGEHPALAWNFPIAQTIRMWREMADGHGTTVQFVRAFVPSDIQPSGETIAPQSDVPFLAVIMRTQGTRPANLREALTCLAAQTEDNFAVLLMVHTANPEKVVSSVTAIVREFDPSFAARVKVVSVVGGGRARPLNVALEQARSEYVAFLDDDDLVTADWVETFTRADSEGAIVRALAAVRHISAPKDDDAVPYLVESSLEFQYHAEFDLIHHFWGNETPICTFAVPRRLIETFSLRFDDRLAVLEDWDFLVRCAQLAPVFDTCKVTSIYQMWRRGSSSASLHVAEVWHATHRLLQERTNMRPLVLPSGSVEQLIRMCQEAAELESTRAGLESARHELAAVGAEAGRRAAEIERLARELNVLHEKYLITINSRRWRVLEPLARAVAIARRWRG